MWFIFLKHQLNPRKLRHRLSLLLLAVIAVLGPLCLQGFPLETEQIRQEEKRKIEQDISKHQISIQRLHEGLQSEQESVERTFQQEKSVLAELEIIDFRLNKALHKLADLQEKMEQQHVLIRTKEAELAKAKAQEEKVRMHLQKRMAAYYKLGKMDLINITFSTQTLPELLSFHDSFQTILKYDQEVFKNYRNIIMELEGVKEALILEQGLLEEFLKQTDIEKTVLNQSKIDKERLFSAIKTQAKLHQQTISEIEKAREDLTLSLLALKKKEELFDQGFFLNKGKHIAPIEGTVISLFNEEKINSFGMKRKNPGISFDAADGTKIRAIFDGTVIFSGYLKGYGNTIILDHGYDYFSIVSRIERVLVTKGSILKRNDIIGLMGATATLIDDGLYFEIRHKEKTLNPLEWLNKDLLHFTRGKK
jgi:septal ring factor EnvC (AmiA/AmiB activator)